ncbi:MAG TPA: MASE1 domain-containing protein [Gemmatimonadaceae bacterium]|nr:MASE1 domain-containing protein [Gemmatimonadaceae bacterium]
MKDHLEGTQSSSAAPGRKRAVHAAELLALAALYVGAARIGLALDAVAGFATLVWAPSGIALAALLLRGNRLWPGVLLGAFVANTLTGAPVLVALGIATGNTLEAVIGAYAVRRIPGFHAALDRVIDALGLIVLSAALSTVVSATIGVASLYFGGIVGPAELGRAWRTWWVGDLIGDLLVAPAILVWAATPDVRPASRHWMETLALVVAVVVIGFAVFGTQSHEFQQAYLIFPLLVWAALRYGPRGAASAALAVSIIAVWGTAADRGPFVQSALHESLFALQTFMGVTAATFLVLGASIAERRAAIREAREAISEQQRLHAERDIAHQRLLTVLEQSPIAIAIAEAPSGRFIFMNEEAERLLGRRPTMSSAGGPEGGEVKGSHPDGRPMAPHEWPLSRALHRGETVRNAIIRIARADETAVEIASNAAPVRDGTGRVIAGVVIFWDVTAERRAEQELRHAHETVAAANRAKAEFFAVMSHELRTPLNAIAGYVEVMSLGIQGPITDQQRDSLERIQRNQQHLLAVIEDVLVFAKLEADRLPLELKVVKVGEALGELDAIVRPALQRKALTLECDACDSTLAVLADPEKLRQILLNLVGNAIKFTPAGGRVRMLAAREGDTIRISVSDTGIGIPADQLTRVFEPFFQVERGPTRRYPGIGLGLSIASDLARAMRGDVQVVSKVDEGTTVSIELPAA